MERSITMAVLLNNRCPNGSHTFIDRGAATGKEHIVHEKSRHRWAGRRYTDFYATIKFDQAGDYWLRSRVSCKDYNTGSHKSGWGGYLGSYWYRSHHQWLSAGGYRRQGILFSLASVFVRLISTIFGIMIYKICQSGGGAPAWIQLPGFSCPAPAP